MVTEEPFAVLVVAIVEHAGESGLLSLVDEAFSVLTWATSSWVGVGEVTGGLESDDCVLLSFNELSRTRDKPYTCKTSAACISVARCCCSVYTSPQYINVSRAWSSHSFMSLKKMTG
ncbi:hypothetical protein X777_00717 [Ooceraea biroi]|uniref:Uncharacterized protein n=1 Tax=Ooceraea biroi TaxID=2015173 RepID=A0A026VVN1_OOCBI|nr:hypothetical protein X777_00717 [Ooceraea biroi]